ncbi:J domain-containing protein [Luteimonas aestuarii]|nr:DnaJ domain-containing protein [Luteimonas aestuarii]
MQGIDNSRTDFIALYRDLRVDPECTPDDFKRAYRKRVSELHPDRRGERSGGEEALKSLNLGYAAAMEFHRMHGRFPGSVAARPIAAGSRPGLHPQRHQYLQEGPDEHVAGRHGKPRWLLLVLLLLLVVLVASLLMDDDATAGTDTSAAPRAIAALVPAVQRPPAGALQVGMLPGEILALVGAPPETVDDGRHWLYGPSWVRVVCGQLTDWYSSPLKPLAGSRMRPGPGDVRDGYQPRQHCVESATPAAMQY